MGMVVSLLAIWGVVTYVDRLNWQTIVLVIVTVVITFMLDRLVVAGVRAMEAAGSLPSLTARIIRRWLRGLLICAAALLLVIQVGQVESIWIPLSTMFAMVAIGFVAVWSVLSNILATVVILVWRPFNVGEHIEVQPDGIGGEVVDLNFMFTALRTEAGEQVSIPNVQFLQKFILRKKVVRKPTVTLIEQLQADKPADE
jgi:small-conductance mechanosensitive channel